MNKLPLKNLIFGKSYLLIYILLCNLGVWLAFYPTLISNFSIIQVNPGDTRLNNYFLEHSFQMLVNRDYRGGLWSPTFFYPYKNVLAFSENLFGAAPVYWLFRSFFSADLAFQLWMIAVCLLCFVSFAILMRRLQVGHILSALGAFLFAFSVLRIARIGHQQLLPQFFTPLAFLSVWEFLKQPTRKRLALLLLLTYLQVLASIYLGWFLLLSLIIFFAIAYSLYPEYRKTFFRYWQTHYKAITFLILSWAALTIITLFPYLEIKSVLGGRSYQEVDTLLPRIYSWLSVPPGSVWEPLLSWASKDLPMPHEHYLFPGFTVILLTGFSIYVLFFSKGILPQDKKWLVISCLLVFIIIFFLCLRFPFGFSLWRIVYAIVPGASAIRAVARIWTVSYFYLFVAIFLCVDSLAKAWISKKTWRLLILSIICLMGVSEQILFNLPGYEKALYIKQASELHELMKRDCEIAYVSLNPQVPDYVTHLTAMWAGIEANVPVVNGYSGNVPPNYGDSSKSMTTAQVAEWLERRRRTQGKKLCMISETSLEKPDSLISKYAFREHTSSSGQFVSHSLQLPLPKEFSQNIKFFDSPKTTEPNSEIKIPVVVKNTSNFFWSHKGKYPTNFSYRWIDSNNNLAIFDGDGNRTELPWKVAPGESVALNAVVKTPPIPGKYRLILTMVQEDVAWFNDKTKEYPEIPIEVISP